MKITKEQLKRIIKEELDNVLESSPDGTPSPRQRAIQIAKEIRKSDHWTNIQPDRHKADVINMLPVGMTLEDLSYFLGGEKEYWDVEKYINLMLQPPAER